MRKPTKEQIKLARKKRPDYRVDRAAYQAWRRAREACGLATFVPLTPEERLEKKRIYARERYRSTLQGGLRVPLR